MDPADSNELSDHGERNTMDLPQDLPRSLNDRKHFHAEFVPETEMYDGWQGKTPRSIHPVLLEMAVD